MVALWQSTAPLCFLSLHQVQDHFVPLAWIPKCHSGDHFLYRKQTMKVISKKVKQRLNYDFNMDNCKKKTKTPKQLSIKSMLQSTTWERLKHFFFNIFILTVCIYLKLQMLSFLNFILTSRISLFNSKFLMRVLAPSMHISLYFQKHLGNWLNSLFLDFKRLGVTVVHKSVRSLAYNALMRYSFSRIILHLLYYA